MNNINSSYQTVNSTDIRFKLGKILEDLERERTPFLIISRSKPKAWLYPFEQKDSGDFFEKWRKTVSSKYKQVKAADLIKLIREDRDR